MKIAFFGIGGVGGYVGGMLARKYDDVYFYGRGENLQVIRDKGLRIESASLGDFIVKPKMASDDAASIGETDLLFITTKGYNLSEVCEQAKPMIGRNTTVIPLLNGVLVSEQITPLLPPCTVADGIIQIFCHLKSPGHVFHQSGGSIQIGMRSGEHPPALDEVAALLNASGIPAILPNDILTASWTKYVGMCGNSTIFSWYGAAAGEVQQQPGYEEVVRAIYGELISVANAKGVELPEDMIDVRLEAFSRFTPETMTSLYRDLSSGKPAEKTELFHLVGRMVQLGKETGVPTPYHQAVLDKYAAG